MEPLLTERQAQIAANLSRGTSAFLSGRSAAATAGGRLQKVCRTGRSSPVGDLPRGTPVNNTAPALLFWRCPPASGLREKSARHSGAAWEHNMRICFPFPALRSAVRSIPRTFGQPDMGVLEPFQFERRCVSSHTACRFAQTPRFFRSLLAGRCCAAASRFAFFNGKTLQLHVAGKRPAIKPHCIIFYNQYNWI